MVLQALAAYQEREDVQVAVERGVSVLAQLQNEDGSYTSFETDSSETISQVILALCELGISMEDERFIVDGKTLADRLLEYRTEDGGFRHTMDGERDMMATEQAFCALVDLYQVQNK
jgi:prenyltransferase beta subunit